MAIRNIFFQPFLLGIIMLLACGPAIAHEVRAVSSVATFERDGTFKFALSLEVMAQGDPTLDDEVSPEQAALNFLTEAVTFHFDKTRVSPEFSLPETIKRDNPLPGENLTTLLYSDATGTVPKGTEIFMVQLSPEIDVNLQMVVIKDGKRERRAHAIYAGEYSRPVNLGFIEEKVIDGDPFTADESGGFGQSFKSAFLQVIFRSEWAILFAVGALLAASVRDLGLQAFALWVGGLLGQAFALLLSEPLSGTVATLIIGLAIIAVAVHNIMKKEVDQMRLSVLAGAGFLARLGWQGSSAPGELVGFQVGSLAALAALLLVIWIILGAFWSRIWYRAIVTIPFSFVLAGVGAFWAVSAFLPSP